MDPISASCYSLHIEEHTRAKLEDQKNQDEFSEVIVSCRSLSRYDSRSFKSLLPQILATVISGSFHIVVGIMLAYSAIMVPQLEKPESDIQVTTSDSSWIASIVVVVTPIGAIAGGFIMDSIGRLNTVKIATVPVTIGWILIATATNVPMILMGRVLTGLAAAWGTAPAIVYITEIARSDMRGSLISCAPAFASLGMVLAYLKGWFLHWRTVAWVCNVYTLVPAILLMFIPESPVWLISKGRIDEARKSLEWINKYQPHPEEKQQTLAEMQLEVLINEENAKQEKNATSQDSGALRKFKAFLAPTGYKPMIILVGLFFFQQFSGIYVTLFFAVTFFEEMGSDINPYFASVMIGVVRFVMSMANTYLLKRFQRRPLVMISASCMAFCMFISGLYTLWIKEGQTTQKWVPVVFLLLYVFSSMIGMLPIPWTMTAELFPIEIRGLSNCISYSFANILMFVSLQSYRTLDKYLGGAHATQWFFAVISIMGVVYAYIFLPETHGKKLSEITEYFRHNFIYLGGPKKTVIVANKRRVSERKPIVINRITVSDSKVEPKQNVNLINNSV